MDKDLLETLSKEELIAHILIIQDRVKSTPAHTWTEDPHDNHYDCERADLIMGYFTDDQLANMMYLYPNIANLTAAKDRIRWLSRKLESASGK